MNSLKTSSRFFALVLFLSAALTGCGMKAQDDEALLAGVNQSELQFVKDIVLGSEYGGDGRCIRFTKSPRVSLFLLDNDARSRNAFNQAVLQLNNALSGSGIQVQVGADADASADIRVFFAPLNSFASVASQYNIGYIPGNTGFFQTDWNGNHEIVRSSIMVASDRLPGNQLSSVILEELTQSMGMGKDQGYNPDSIFYETSFDPGFAQSYSALDLRVIRFFYRYVSPGDGERELTRKFARNWN